MSKAVFTKFVTALAIAAFNFWGISYPAFGGLDYINFNSIETLVIVGIIGIIDLVLCYTPVNFSNDSTYNELLKEKMNTRKQQRKPLSQREHMQNDK